MDSTYSHRKVSIICPEITGVYSPFSFKENIGDMISEANKNSWLLNEINTNGKDFKMFMRSLDMGYSLLSRRFNIQGTLLGVCYISPVECRIPPKINGLLRLFVSYSVITKSEYTSYLEFGIEDLGVISNTEQIELTNMDILKGINESL